MMALINNWDLKEINNEILDEGGEPRYEVADLGASFGRTGNPFGRSKGVMKDYAKTKFIEKVTPESVDFVMHSRPFFLTISISPTTASVRGWRVWPSTFLSRTHAGSATGSASFPPNRSATAFAPPASRPPRSRAIPGS